MGQDKILCSAYRRIRSRRLRLVLVEWRMLVGPAQAGRSHHSLKSLAACAHLGQDVPSLDDAVEAWVSVSRLRSARFGTKELVVVRSSVRQSQVM